MNLDPEVVALDPEEVAPKSNVVTVFYQLEIPKAQQSDAVAVTVQNFFVAQNPSVTTTQSTWFTMLDLAFCIFRVTPSDYELPDATTEVLFQGFNGLLRKVLLSTEYLSMNYWFPAPLLVTLRNLPALTGDARMAAMVFLHDGLEVAMEEAANETNQVSAVALQLTKRVGSEIGLVVARKVVGKVGEKLGTLAPELTDSEGCAVFFDMACAAVSIYKSSSSIVRTYNAIYDEESVYRREALIFKDSVDPWLGNVILVSKELSGKIADVGVNDVEVLIKIEDCLFHMGYLKKSTLSLIEALERVESGVMSYIRVKMEMMGKAKSRAFGQAVLACANVLTPDVLSAARSLRDGTATALQFITVAAKFSCAALHVGDAALSAVLAYKLNRYICRAKDLLQVYEKLHTKLDLHVQHLSNMNGVSDALKKSVREAVFYLKMSKAMFDESVRELGNCHVAIRNAV